VRQLHYGRHCLSGSSGAALATRGWASSIASAGAEVELVVDANTKRLDCPEGITCYSLTHVGSRKLGIPRGMRARLEGSDLLVVHAGLRPHTAFAAREALRVGIPYIVSAHGIYLEGAVARNLVAKRLAMVAFERAYLQRAAAIHVYFEEEARDLRAIGIDRPLIIRAPGVSVPAGFRWDGGTSGRLLWLGRFDRYQKGLDLLLEAVALMSTSERPLLHLVGPDWRGNKSTVLGHCRELGLGDWVTVGGPLYGEAKWALLASALGFVYPSRFEAFGMSVAEAVSLGIPTLATPFALSRFLAKDDAIVLAEPTPPGLADGMRQLTTDRGKEVAANGARVAEVTFVWRAAATSWLEQATAVVAQPGW
jgi:glycosyltransferase involved in cell wall biosynthesis